MLEQLKTPDLLNEAYIVAETQKEISQLKERIILEGIEKKKECFGDYLQKEGIDRNKFPRNSGLGKFLRTFRYYKDIKNISTEKNIPLNYFFGLKMIEGEGDPSNINTLDGGAGISQIQPDTFKQFGRDNMKRNFKVFSDDPRYTYYDYTNLTKNKGKTRKEANAIIANKLVEIRKELNYDISKLMALDDRFNPDIALEFSAEYLLYCKKQISTKGFTDTSWDVYKNDKKFDFEWMLALNGYNKGPKSFDVDVTGNHLKNLKDRINQYDLYSERLTELLKKGYTYEDVVRNISLSDSTQRTKTPVVPEKKTPIIQTPNIFQNISSQQKETSPYDPTNKNSKEIIYLNKSSDQQSYVYKYTVQENSNRATQLQNIYKTFGFGQIQITNAAGKEYEPSAIPTTPGSVFYIKEKILQ